VTKFFKPLKLPLSSGLFDFMQTWDAGGKQRGQIEASSTLELRLRSYQGNVVTNSFYFLFIFIIILLVYWEYTVTLAKVLKIYLS
jgi:hypothetical protein